MVESVREILSQNGFDTGMLGIIDFVTNHELLIEMIGKNPTSMLSLLRVRHTPENVIGFLTKHMELFDFVVLVSDKMKAFTGVRYEGDDLKPEEDLIAVGKKNTFYLSKSRMIAAGAAAAVIMLVILVISIVL